MLYVQCKLKKENSFIISWIPEKFAKIGKVVRVKFDDVFEDNWVVDKTYGSISEKQAKLQEQLYKQHRKGTDV